MKESKHQIINIPDPLIEEQVALKKLQNQENFSTAMGGKRKLEVQELFRSKIIVVDMREFSSSTPQYLYDAGFWVIPVTLNIGDFVLSDDIVVEKKAVSTHDLHQSLNSGRLLKQITLMSKYYKQVILLLEFDDSIKFRLRDMYRMADDRNNVNNSSVFSKLTLLMMNFPNVTILWSKSQKDTVKIFERLKRNCPNPDLVRVEKIGKVIHNNKHKNADVLDAIEPDEDEELRNKHLPQDFLRSLPGVSHKNIHVWFKGIKNVTQILKLSKEELIERCGDSFGKDIYKCLHDKIS